METGSRNQGEIDYTQLTWPSSRWSLLCIRAWVQGLGESQVPDHKRVKAPIPADLTMDDRVPGTAKFQLQLQEAGLRREWDLQTDEGMVWKAGYRTAFYSTWLPFHVVRPPEPPLTKPEPDSLAVLCPSHLVSFMLEQATSMLVFRPGYVSLRDGQEVVTIVEGSCLTIAQGFLEITAHLPLNSAPDFPLAMPENPFFRQSMEEIRQACALVKSLVPGARYWLPLLPDPQALTALRY